MQGSAAVSSQIAAHGGGLFGADQWGLLAIALGVLACVVLGIGLRMLLKSRQHHTHKSPYERGRGPRYGSRGR